MEDYSRDIEFASGDSSFSGINENRIVDKSTNYGALDINIPFRKILGCFLLTYVWTLVLTGVPLFVEIGPNNYYANHPNWYTGSDVMRLIEPFGGFLLNFLIFHQSEIFRREPTKSNIICIFVFFFGAAMYGQGAGFHSAANMFKNSLETIDHDDRDLQDLAYYMRTVWEHIVGHYLYAAGYAIMNACQLFAYKDHKASQLGLTFSAKALLVLASGVYALLIAGVAANFPSGTIVSFIYLVLYGGGVVGGYVFYVYQYGKEDTVLKFGNRPILHHFLLSYLFALILVIAWICAVGGFRSRSEAGVA